MSATAKLRKKGRELLEAKNKVNAPEFDAANYTRSLIDNLNFYSSAVDNKLKRKWVFDYAKKNNIKVDDLTDMHDGYFSTIGAVAHMISRGIALKEADKKKITKRLDEIRAIAVKEKAESQAPAPKKVVVSVQDRMVNLSRELMGEIDHAIDELCYKGIVFDVKNFLKQKQVSAPVAKLIAAHYKPLLKETAEAAAGTDEQLKEGYSHFTKVGRRKFNEYIADLITACENHAVVAKVARAPRKRKEKPPAILAAKVRYLKEFPELNLKSVTPEKVVGAEEVWLFNAKNRRLQRYVALDGVNLTVKGNKILNWDPEKSGTKILRKPALQLEGCADFSKRPFGKLYSEIKATEGKVNGRFNESTLILGAFK